LSECIYRIQLLSVFNVLGWFNASFNNISFISSRSVLLLEETGVPGETIDLSQITENLITKCCIAYASPEHGSNSHLQW